MSQQPQSSAGKELLLSLVSNACNSQLVEEHQLMFLFFFNYGKTNNKFSVYARM